MCPSEFANQVKLLLKQECIYSRMCTVRCSGCLRGCLPGGSAWAGVCLGGLPRGCLPRGCLPRGCLPGGCTPPWSQRQNPPVNRITDRCKNITFPQLLLQMVIMFIKNSFMLA